MMLASRWSCRRPDTRTLKGSPTSLPSFPLPFRRRCRAGARPALSGQAANISRKRAALRTP